MNKQYPIFLAITGLGAALSAFGSASGAQSAVDIRTHFEPASVAVPAGNTCELHPEGTTDPRQAIPVRADADGVARFYAVRPVSRGSLERLSLECSDANGNGSTYPVDLRSQDTFAPRPFDPSRTTMTLRPALTGDPMSYAQGELVRRGYGLRPDPAADPSGYKRWLATATVPVYKARATTAVTSAPTRAVANLPPAVDAGVFDKPYDFWTGPIMRGSFQPNKNPDLTQSYVSNSATWNVPTVTKGGLGTNAVMMSIWNGLDNVFQTIVFVSATSSTLNYWIQRQNFLADAKTYDHAGVDFTPAAGDQIWTQIWYCDAKGNQDMSGGYACTWMLDATSGIAWECDQADGKDCASYPLESKYSAIGTHGTQAEFIIENDSPQAGSGAGDQEWPDFSPVTMIGNAWVVQGAGTSGGFSVNTETDPNILLYTDGTASNPFVRGDGHLRITLSYGGAVWQDQQTNVYFWGGWSGANFDSYSEACASSIAVGPNSRELTTGTPWITGCSEDSAGNRSVYQMQTGGAWVKMQDDIATQVAVSPEGIAWAIDAGGNILYWNGSKFVVSAAGGCASSIGVGPNSPGLTNGTPWITGCSKNSAGNRGVYQMQAGGWVKMQDDIANQIAVSPEGIAWAVAANGDILYWNGSKFVVNAAGGCASSIAVGPNSSSLPNGSPAIMGCSTDAAGNRTAFQLQSAASWTQLQSGVGTQIAVSPAGDLWALSTLVK